MEECKALRCKKDCFIRIGKYRYKEINSPYNVIINTSKTPKTKEENDRRLREIGHALFMAHLKQERKSRGLTIEDLVL